MRGYGRWVPGPRGLLAACAAVAVVLSLAPPGAAAREPDTAAAPAAPAAGPVTDLAPGTYPVTLVTGDRVQLTVYADQTVAVGFTAVARPDGSTPSGDWYTADGGIMVVPDDARIHLAAGRLDHRLFDVAYLARQGFTDARTSGLPLILEYADQVAPATALRAAGVATADAQPLASIQATAVEVSSDSVADIWASVSSGWTTGSTSRAGTPAIQKLWLDGVAEVALDVSVPQIGAPYAWDLGLDGTGVTVAVLDTGVDFTHPDLAGKVVASRSFVPGADTAVDGHGHGTHVAATVAGSGAASGGNYRGVAPGASLVIGKVCDDGGSCSDSAVIAGMEWAAREQGADVINLSLSGCCTDGTDPMSQAVNELSAETGALFVISAGNSGQPNTVGTPGTADAALTVAAVDDGGAMAGFSSRGPRLGDGGFKPEIAAPGVGIVAARAAGTAMPSPVNDDYTSSNGTSMASPHVAGAAALLAQQRPDWDGQRLRAALIASARNLGHDGYAQGAGLVDVAGAVDQRVEVSPAVADFGLVPYPPEGDPKSRTVTYTNPTDSPVTLGLTVARAGGGSVPEGVLSLDASSLTVPAGGTAGVTVSIDHTRLAAGTYSWMLLASDPTGVRLTTPIGISIGEQNYALTITLAARDCGDDVYCAEGLPSFRYDFLHLFRVGPVPGTEGVAVAGAGASGDEVAGQPIVVPLDPGARVASDQVRITEEQDSVTVTMVVPEGLYEVRWMPNWVDLSNRTQYAVIWDPEVIIPGDTTVELDANQAVKVNHHTTLPTADAKQATSGGHRLLPGGGVFESGHWYSFVHGNLWTYWEPVVHGGFVVYHGAVLEKPPITMQVNGPEPLALSPVYSADWPEGHPGYGTPVRFPARTQTLPVVDVGTGSAAEYEGVDVTGALVLVTDPRGPWHCGVPPERLEIARAAGAAGVVYNAGYCQLPVTIESLDPQPDIPYVLLPKIEWEQVAARVAAGPVSITLTGTSVSPYAYQVRSYEDGALPASIDYHYPHDQVMTIDASFHLRQDGWIDDIWTVYRDGIPLDFNANYIIPAPQARTIYVAPVGERYRHNHAFGNVLLKGWDQYYQRMDVYTGPGRVTQRLAADPWVPSGSVPRNDPYRICAGCREQSLFGDEIFWALHVLRTGDPQQFGTVIGGFGPISDDPADPYRGLRMFRNGEELPADDDTFGSRMFLLPPEPSDYRLELDYTAGEDRTITEWEFRSGSGTGPAPVGDSPCFFGMATGLPLSCQVEPLIYLRYAGLDTDLYDRVAAPGAHWFEVHVERQASTEALPTIAGLKLWVSYDDGETWQQAQVKAQSGGRYEVKVVHPPATQRVLDSVTLRAEAWDVAGNRVSQIVPDAYRLTHRGGSDGSGWSL